VSSILDSEWRYRASYIPFPLPVPALCQDPLANPDTTLRFNSDWAPYLLGAMKVLARRETYFGTDEDIDCAAQSAQDWIDNVASQLGSPSFPPAICGYDFVADGQQGWFLQDPGACGPGYFGEWSDVLGFTGTCLWCPAYGITYGACFIEKVYSAPIKIYRVSAYYSLEKGSGTRDEPAGIYVFNGGSLVGYQQQDWKAFTDGGDQLYEFVSGPGVMADHVYIQLRFDEYNGNVSCGGMLDIFRVEVEAVVDTCT